MEKYRCLEIPEDVMIGILIRLPVKSLVRFKSVSKSWYSLISNKNFITNHLNFNLGNNQNNGLLLVRRCIEELSNEKFITSIISEKTMEEINSSHLTTPASVDDDSFLQIHGPFNGIYCLFSGLRIVLWNPATAEYKSLHPPGIRSSMSIGFAYDSRFSDYKLIALAHHDDDSKLYLAMLYTLSNDSWKSIECFPQAFIYSDLSNDLQAYVNGACHWRAVFNNRGVILSFDMGDEVFKIVPLPEFEVLGNEIFVTMPLPDCVGMLPKNISLKLAVWDECMALITFPQPRGYDNCFDIWVMKEYGVVNSWTKLYTVKGPPIVGGPVGISETGEFICEIFRGNGELIWYDPYTNDCKKIQMHERGHSFIVVGYMESLVSLRGESSTKIVEKVAGPSLVREPFSGAHQRLRLK